MLTQKNLLFCIGAALCIVLTTCSPRSKPLLHDQDIASVLTPLLYDSQKKAYYNSTPDEVNPVIGYALYKFTSGYGNSIGAWTDYHGVDFVATEVPEPLNVLGSVTGIALFGSLANLLKKKSSNKDN